MYVPTTLMLTAVDPVSPPPANGGGYSGGYVGEHHGEYAGRTRPYSAAVRADDKDGSRLGRIADYMRALLFSRAVEPQIPAC